MTRVETVKFAWHFTRITWYHSEVINRLSMQREHEGEWGQVEGTRLGKTPGLDQRSICFKELKNEVSDA